MTVGQLQKKDQGVEIELLLAHVLNKPKEFLYLHPETKLSPDQSKKLSMMIRRREKGEPVAYILGYKDFYGLRFKVTKDTLVPRPETELIVDLALNLIKKYKFRSVIDVGTGSGCIAISIAKNSKAKVIGSDISKKALVIANQNAKKNNVEIHFRHNDLLSNVVRSPELIIANLPYGWADWKNNSSTDTRGLKFEPKTALFTKEKGLYQVRRLLEQVSNIKEKPKFILLEFDPRQKQDLAKLVKKILPNSKPKFYRDLAKHWRAARIAI